jgi:hypothetical protein
LQVSQALEKLLFRGPGRDDDRRRWGRTFLGTFRVSSELARETFHHTINRLLDGTFETLDIRGHQRGQGLLGFQPYQVRGRTFRTFPYLYWQGEAFTGTPGLQVLESHPGWLPRSAAALSWQADAVNSPVQPLSRDADALDCFAEREQVCHDELSAIGNVSNVLHVRR